SGACWPRPIACMASVQPCSSATSTSRHSPNCWPKWMPSAGSSATLPRRRWCQHMAEAPVALREQQIALSRHLRDPEAAPAPRSIEPRRGAVYRDLLCTNLPSLLAGNFPVIGATLADPDWRALVRAFYSGHRCQAPVFTEIGREFVRWLDARQSTDPALPSWLAELAHYEWVELALQISDAEPGDDVARVR